MLEHQRRRMKRGKDCFMKKYSREKKTRKGTVILIAVIIALAALKICAAEKPAWDVCYEMPNRHIEWTYAGR